MDASRPSGSRSWQARPFVGKSLRAFVLVAPIVVAVASSIVANHLIPRGDSLAISVLRVIPIMIISTGVVWVCDKGARKLLPLAVLMQLSLVFPDQAPSRFKAALKSGSSRHLGKLVDETRRNGLSSDPGEAARQVVQLIGVLGDHDRRTRGHSERVRLYAEMIGKELHLSGEERQKLQWGALLHDLGKLMVPTEILNKSGQPDAKEWEIIRGHPAAGMKLVEPLKAFLGEWAEAIGGHHEKWDGTGYPRQLKAGQISRAAAIVAVADSFEVMTAVRSYKKAMSMPEARAELTRCAGTHFSPEVVRAFLSISLGQVRWIAGPLAALSHVPYVGNLLHIPAAAAGVPGVIGSAVVPVTAGAILSTASVLPSVFTAPADQVQAIASNVDGHAVIDLPASEVAGLSRISEELQELSPVVGGDTNGGSTPNDVGHITTPLLPGEVPSTTTTPTPTTTTPTTTTPTTTTPTTTVVSPTPDGGFDADSSILVPEKDQVIDEVSPVDRLVLMVSKSKFYLNPQPLDGSSFSPGTTIYIFARTNGAAVDYQYPGGSYSALEYPYDMLGRSLWFPKGFVVPQTKGKYSIVATVTGNGEPETITATFNVT